MIPDLTGQTVMRVKLDFGLLIWTAEGWEIQLNGPTHLAMSESTATIDVNESTEELPEYLSNLLGRRITCSRVSEAGELMIEVDEVRLTVAPDPQGEAWQLAGPRGVMIVCLPSGELESWGPRDN